MSLVIPTDSTIYQQFEGWITTKRIVFVAGLPAVGKSLYLQQLAHLAHIHNRPVHLLQWDVARSAFETQGWLERYPERDGVTHPAIRKAAGLWSRQAILQWHQKAPPSHVLVGELPLIGNRLIEVVQRLDEPAESLLSGELTQTVIPVPSLAVRAHLEQRRQHTIDNPKHERERADAPPPVVKQLWHAVHDIGVRLGYADRTSSTSIDYEPLIYAKVFAHLLKYRHHTVFNIDTIYKVSQSVYAMESLESELVPSPQQVRALFAEVDSHYLGDALQQSIDNWWQMS